MVVLFLGCIAILVQAYVAYPLTLLVLRIVRGDRSRHIVEDRTPSVRLVVSAYNEEKVLRQKLENSLGLDYPADRLRIVVVSDGSTDGSDGIARAFAPRGVELRVFAGRQGKVACLNQVVPGLGTDLVVMSDANSLYERDSLRRLARHFADERIGCVCGALRYVNPRRLAAGEGERVYWGYEGLIKRLESSLGSLLGANGAIYAYRRSLFRPVDPLMFCDDVIPIRIAIAGYLTIYDPEARCTEESASERVERRRRRRHASFGLRSILRVSGEAARRRRLLLLYECLSHRILRWGTGLALAGILLSSPFLPAPWRVPALAGQALLYGTASLGFLASRLGLRITPLYLPYYFLAISASGVSGLLAWLRRIDLPYWEPRQ
jgi:cellulose synthase/poly-beta-1,6-N-acetylglucosamine synthase-like glycosyltransferase